MHLWSTGNARNANFTMTMMMMMCDYAVFVTKDCSSERTRQTDRQTERQSE